MLLRYMLTVGLFVLLAIPAKAEPQKVYTNIYLMNLYDLNMEDHTFYADFYIWFRWKGDINPVEKLEFVNIVEKWSLNQVMFEDSTRVLNDGWNYNGMRIEGRFYHSFELKDFPLDKHALQIQIENAEYSSDSLLFVPGYEPANRPQMMRKDLRIAGWDVLDYFLSTQSRDYGTVFGDTDIKQPVPFSTLSYQLIISRPVSFFYYKLLLPLLIVILASLSAMLIFPGYIDARGALPIAALLTAVFLQQSYSNSLPDIGYMILMDKIYTLAYGVIIVSLIEIIMTGNWVKHNDEQWVRRARRMDRVCFIVLLLVFLGGTAWLIWGRG